MEGCNWSWHLLCSSNGPKVFPCQSDNKLLIYFCRARQRVFILLLLHTILLHHSVLLQLYITTMDDDSGSPAPLPSRSAASMNWRTKDDSPRPAPQPRAQNRERSFDQRQNYNGSSTQQASDQSSSNRLYVGNLLYTASRSDVENFFAEHNFPASNVQMSTDPFTGRNPS